MRISKLPYVFVSALMLSVSCSKETSVENDEATITDTDENTDDPIDGTGRSAAKKLYTDYYMASSATTSDLSWTGDEPSCDAGSTPQATKDKIFMRLSYFRKAVGLNNGIAENSSKSDKAQKAALMMHANGTLNHNPPNNWKCFSTDGEQGAKNSLLTSTKNADAIDSYIRDQGNDNFPVGHRRWLLWPQLQEIGIGNTSSYNAIWVLGDPGTRPADTPEFIAWPPQGYLPKQVAYTRWSFSIAKADFTETKIAMKIKNGGDLSLEIEELTGIYGDNTIVWMPSINTNTLDEDTAYVVSLSNVGIGGEIKNFEYEVVLFDANE